MKLVKEVYEVTATFPDSEKFGLVNQMRRASVSIPSNIAEGSGSQSQVEFRRYLIIARASTNELETQIEISGMLGYMDLKSCARLQECITTLRKQIQGFIRSVESSISTNIN